MSSVFRQPSHKSSFRNVTVGQKVVLDDGYIAENHVETRLETIALKTMENAELQAQACIEKAQAEAQALLQAAQAEAARIVQEEGLQQRDAIIQQAYEEGYTAGLKTAYDQIAEETAEMVSRADAILSKAYEAQGQLILQQSHHLAAVLQYVLKLVLSHELQTRPEHLVALLEKAAEQIQFSGHAKIILNPETLQSLKSFSPQVMEALHQQKHLIFYPDMACSPHEMYLETVDCNYDISPESQTAVLMQAVETQLKPVPDPQVLPPWTQSHLPQEADRQTLPDESQVIALNDISLDSSLEEDQPETISDDPPLS